MRVSVVIPTYNRRQLIGAAIDSALAQEGAEVEVLVVDDGSTDGSVAWLREAYRDRVRVLANAGRKGPAGGRNTGLRAATGAFVALLDSDDAFLPGHLAQALDVFGRHPEVGVLFGRAQYEKDGVVVDYMGPNFERKLAASPAAVVDADCTVFSSAFFTSLLELGCWFNLSTVVLRREHVGAGMDETLRISEDYEYWVRLARTCRFACLHRPQIRYALHDDNVSFEADASVEGHAPRLLQALDAIEAASPLDARERGLVDAQRSTILYDWAWRAASAKRLAAAARLHLRSMAFGKRVGNALALAKLPLRWLR